MLTASLKHYTSPKWTSSISDPKKHFITKDGLHITNIYELKNFLKTCDVSEFSSYVGSDFNHLADWIEGSIGDQDLAQAMRLAKSRWESIISLERHMLRTRAYPKHVAQRVLRRAYQPFIFNDGRKVASLQELLDNLEEISDETFEHHQSKKPSDLSLWIHTTIGDPELGSLVESATTTKELAIILKEYLEKLRKIINT